MLGCFVGGGVLTGTAFLVEARWNWQGVSPAVLVNVGAGLGLAGVLFLLERRFTGAVMRASERAAEQVARQVEQRFEARAEELAARLDSLQDQVNQRVRERAAEQDAMISGLAEDVTFDTVTKILTEANGLRAIDNGTVTVQASKDPDGIGLVFRWGMIVNDDRRAPGPHLDIEARIEPDLDKLGGRPVIRVEWRPGEPAADVGHRLVDELMRAGRWQGDGTLDWELALRNLQRSIDVAISSRRRDPDAWHLNGAVIELVGQDWVISTAGLECPSRGYLLRHGDFPQEQHPSFGVMARAMGAENAHEWQPDRPEWADPDEWARLVRRGRREFPRSPLIMAALSPIHWEPWQGQPPQG